MHILVEVALLQLEKVESGYGRARALHGVDLTVAAGEAVALIGANGAGKSTILRAISGLNRVLAGSIRFDGKEIGNATPRQIVRLGVAHCPEERKIWPNLTVLEHLELGATIRGGAGTQDIDEMYTLFPILNERRHQLAGTLSGGQQQMVAIARALMSRPRLLMLDEPSLGLAPKVTEEVLTTIRRVNGTGTAILLVEQNASLALAATSRAYVIENGLMSREGSTAELANDPAIRSAYLGVLILMRRLIENIDTLHTCDDEGRVLRRAWIVVAGSRIAALGDGPPPAGDFDERIDLSSSVAMPGLVNAHHHFFQTLTRALPRAQRGHLLDWLSVLYPVWGLMQPEDLAAVASASAAELLLTGATTTVDHFYLVPRCEDAYLETEVEALGRMGIRLHLVRGSMTTIEKRSGGTPQHYARPTRRRYYR
ncbi:ABC-type branched-subunit amino acid transport system ATPase component [Bradyrhizobium sp. F1.13.4]